MLDAADERRQNCYWLGAELVAEIVTPDNSERDTFEKRGAYAAVGVPEYWIVNQLNQTITVLHLEGASYRAHGRFRRSSCPGSRSELLPSLMPSRPTVVVEQAMSEIMLRSDEQRLELAIMAWLDAKSQRSGSAKTATAYRSTLQSFRSYLWFRWGCWDRVHYVPFAVERNGDAVRPMRGRAVYEGGTGS